jgi:hypothetical protein
VDPIPTAVKSAAIMPMTMKVGLFILPTCPKSNI